MPSFAAAHIDAVIRVYDDAGKVIETDGTEWGRV